MQTIRIALAGNPNSGKTTLFNRLTGSRQHVGNYPGVTVEKKEGVRESGQWRMEITDLPGTYSLAAHSVEERVARQELLHQTPDVVVNVVDASNIERNLYLTFQLLEMKVPLIVVLNMMDVAQSRGMAIDLKKMAVLLGVPVIPVVASKGRGLDDVTAEIEAVMTASSRPAPLDVRYGKEVEKSLDLIGWQLFSEDSSKNPEQIRWTAVKLLERDDEMMDATTPAVLAVVDKEVERLIHVTGDEPDILIAEQRYGVISGVIQQSIRSSVEQRVSMSDRVDHIVTHRVLGLPIFAVLMYCVFYMTFTFGALPMDWIDAGFGALTGWVDSIWPADQMELIHSLVTDGIIAGVGGVLIFLPNILLLFLAIAVLEDTGYMARAAFLMDRLMNKIGLHGKSFIPMLIGFGCSVPAIMATRTLDNRRDRLTTMFVVPLSSCGARLPIYALIIPAFFAKPWQAPLLWLIYIIGLVLAVVVAKILRISVLQGPTEPFVMELPPYRVPTFSGIMIHVWERSKLYLKKAGTLILGISILLWALTTFPQSTPDPSLSEELQQSQQLAHTFAGRIGHVMEPVIKPMGFDWRIGTALIGAFAAKEVFVAQLGIVYSVGESDETSQPLREQLQKHYNPLTGFCIMLFCLISAPCMATIAVTKRESNSWRWALFQLGGLTLLAWVLTTAVYQIGSLAGIGV